MDISERNFEETIVQGLAGDAPGGYSLRAAEDYDRELCLDARKVYDFIIATQPKEWEKLEQHYRGETREQFCKRLTSEVEKRGTVDVLRRGIKDRGCKFEMAHFRPVSGLNVELQNLYEANQFTVIRQLNYSTKGGQSLDLALFLNGMPIFTAELKTLLTGQRVSDAVWQYRNNRDPREPLFDLGRCLAHFAVDTESVYVATQLQGPTSDFLPFNRGWNGGAGNPPSLSGFPAAYLWEEVWTRDSVLNLIQHFVHEFEEEEEDANGRKTKRRRLIFPRYHQLDSVRRLVTDARASGPGNNYLIQHSAGSGKSNSIAWLAHQLSVLHDDNDERVFDSIVVVTDRRVLDQQLQRTVRQFEQVRGTVENIDKTSRQLKQALEQGKNIIVTTLQKFPVIVGEIGEMPGHSFALIIDEAHSSQTGEAARDMRAALADRSLEEAEEDEGGEVETLEDRIVAEMQKRGPQDNLSLFAFTATPKARTLEMFGARQPDGTFKPFSLYTMRQAIDEHFILDVLENYTTYRTYWSLRKKIEDDPRYERGKATYLLKQYVDLHPHNIEEKVNIILDHFDNHVRHRIKGRAKAMIVTRSRLHAVRYRLAVDQRLKEMGAPYQALVAFTGTVRDGGMDYTEYNMNGFPERQTANTFGRDEYRILIVAEKFQTGFDQPLLHTMYVDRKLGGVHAVQTLSRLNRVRPDKEETMVLDFANEAEAIKEAFEPYYDRILLTEETDPNILYDLERQLAEFGFYDQAEIGRLAEVYWGDGSQAQLRAILQPCVDRYTDVGEDEQSDFRSMLTKYVRLYSFLSQIIAFSDPDLERLYVFARLLLRVLPVEREELPRHITDEIDMDSYRIQQISDGSISLDRGQGELEPMQEKSEAGGTEDEEEALSQIIEELNERFGTDFAEDDKVFIEQLEQKLADDESLAASVNINPPENARLTFDHVVNDRLQEMIDANFKFYKEITDDEDFGSFFLSWLFSRYLARSADTSKANDEPSARR